MLNYGNFMSYNKVKVCFSVEMNVVERNKPATPCSIPG